LNVREWIYADEHSRAVWLALQKGVPGNVYNIGSGDEKTNLEVVRAVLRILGKPESLITFVKDRPGHDRRYAIDHSKIAREWGWSSRVDFEHGLQQTVDWYRSMPDWIREIKDESYLSYYQRMYTRREETFARLDSREAQAPRSSPTE
jgi:dTDP-glucose 4,6-dehydratase